VATCPRSGIGQSHTVCTSPLPAIDSSAVINGTLAARAAAITILS
jgi:hypothetical protein